MQSASTTTRFYSFGYNEFRTYLIAIAFIIGNIALPQMIHTIPNGGHIWLPIYFFTLIAAYKYGWKAGLLTAIASPLVNSMAFGMPAAAALPAIMMKSVLLALFAAMVAARFNRASLWMLATVVLTYQTGGTLCEWAITADLGIAISDFQIGLPGMIVQTIGGWLVINRILCH